MGILTITYSLALQANITGTDPSSMDILTVTTRRAGKAKLTAKVLPDILVITTISNPTGNSTGLPTCCPLHACTKKDPHASMQLTKLGFVLSKVRTTSITCTTIAHTLHSSMRSSIH